MSAQTCRNLQGCGRFKHIRFLEEQIKNVNKNIKISPTDQLFFRPGNWLQIG